MAKFLNVGKGALVNIDKIDVLFRAMLIRLERSCLSMVMIEVLWRSMM